MKPRLTRLRAAAARYLPDSLFSRLAWLLAVVVLSSHVLVLTLLFRLPLVAPPAPPPAPPFVPPAMPQQGPPPGPPRGMPPAPGHGMEWGLLLDIGLRLLALMAAAWVGARWLAEPVRRLADAAQALGNDLHSPPLAESGTTECRQAIRVFNQMRSRIQTHMQQRDQFVAAVSHDLRTPLTRLALRVQSLPDEADRQQFGRDIQAMDDMIRTTLDYLRGAADPEPRAPVELVSLLQSVAEDHQDSGDDVRWLATPGGPAQALVWGQAQALRRALENLVGNAVRYGLRARLTLESDAEHWGLWVEDDGPGIAPELLTQVVQPFFRIEGSRNRRSGGVGLGLASAQEIAQRHTGQLLLRNHPGGGLKAGLMLPKLKQLTHAS